LFDRLLSVSAFSARELRFPPARTRLVYGGADPRRFRPDPALTRSGVLFVGRITPHKGLDRLIQALPPGAQLTIVGSGGHDPRPPERDYPLLLRRLADGRDVRFPGPASEDELPTILRQAAVLALPSVQRTCYGRAVRVSELLGLVVLEAMASGTPVVASRLGGLVEVVQHGVTGFLVEPGNVAELRERLAEILCQPALAARLGRAARDEVNIKVRQPLHRLVCVVPGTPPAALAELAPLLAQELNVKRVEFAASEASFVRLEARPNFRALGKRFGKRTPLAAQAVAALSDDALRAYERGEVVAISVEGEEHVLQPDDVTIVRRAGGELVVKEEGGFFAALDATVTPELRREGLARELVSRVQRARKDAGLAVSDRIALYVSGGEEAERVAREYGDYISSEVLATELVIGAAPPSDSNAVRAVDLDGVPAVIAIRRKD
jgi:glycosyltransferase involved in cell wall biosynthesis